MYFSLSHSVLYFCNSRLWLPIPLLGISFGGSSLLTVAGDTNLARAIGHSTWLLCYKASVNGFSATAFHQGCDQKGPTLTLLQSNQGNQVFGGYIDQPWASRGLRAFPPAAATHATTGSYAASNAAFIFRFAANTLQTTTIVFPQYAMFDASVNGPSFGNGDLLVNSNMKTGSCSQSSYFSPSYSSSWLAGTPSSWTLTAAEVYYKA